MILTTFVEIIKKGKELKKLCELDLSEAFLPIIGDSVQFPKTEQMRVIDRHFWLDIEAKKEYITIYLVKKP